MIPKNNFNRGKTIATKGIPKARNYKIARLGARTKADRIKAEGQIRNQNYETLTAQESKVFSVLRDFGRDVLELTGRGLTIDESIYAREIVSKLRK